MAAPTVHDVLSTDSAAGLGVLLNLLGSASAGGEISGAVPDVLQAVFARSSGNAQLRKLAYEVCKAASLGEKDHQKLLAAIKSDLNSPDASVTAAGLDFLPYLPGPQLADLLQIGELTQLVGPALASEATPVRAAAVRALSAIALNSDVTDTASSSTGFASAFEELWDQLMDALLDEAPAVVAAACAATTSLLDAGLSATPNAASGFMLSKVSGRAAMRLSAALGPVLEVCGVQPLATQALVSRLLVALVCRLDALHASGGAAAAGATFSGNVVLPPLGAVVSSACLYLSRYFHCPDATACYEASKAVLDIAGELAADAPASGAEAAGGGGAGQQRLPQVSVPEVHLLAAVSSLVELRSKQFMEVVLGDVCMSIACALPALAPPSRAAVLRALWPLASRMPANAQRVQVYALAWRAAAASELSFRASPAAAVASTPFSQAATAGASANGGLGMGLGMDGGASPLDALGQLSVALPDGPLLSVKVPASQSVSSLLLEPYMEVVLSGRVPMVPEPVHNVAGVQFSPTLITNTPSMSGASAASPTPAGGANANATGASLEAISTSTTGGLPENDGGSAAGGGRDGGKAGDGGGAGGGGAAAAGGKGEKRSIFSSKMFGSRKDDAPSFGRDAKEVAAAAASSGTAPAGGALLPQLTGGSPPSPRAAGNAGAGGAGGAGGGAGAGSASHGLHGGVEGGVAGAAPGRLSAQRHEVLGALLEVLRHHPAAEAAWELVSVQQAAALHDRPLGGGAGGSGQQGGGAGGAAQGHVRVSHWLAMCVEVLQETYSCVSWEPAVMPAISAQPSVAAQNKAPADFSSVVADSWLQLLHACVHTANALQTALRTSLQAGGAAGAGTGGLQQQPQYGSASGGSSFAMGLGLPGPSAGAELQQALLTFVEGKARALQVALSKVLLDWPNLSRAIRPRVMWVAAQVLALPPHSNDAWDILIRCLSDLLTAATASATSRAHDLMGSAYAGSMFKAGRVAWTSTERPFLFDIAAASALCEAAEYEGAGVVSGLCAVQALTGRLGNDVAAAVPLGATGKAHADVSAVARKLDGLVKYFSSTEAAAPHHIRDWCKRLTRQLQLLITYVPQATLPPVVAALGFVAKAAHHADGENGDAAAAAAANDDDDSSNGNGNNDNGNSSDDSSAYGDQPAGGQQGEGAMQQQPSQDVGTGGDGRSPTGAAGGRQRTSHAGAASTSYIVHSAAAHCVWGYPFSGPTSAVLFSSKRSRRHRALASNLAAAAAATLVPRRAPPPPPAAGARSSPSHGPVLSSTSGFRLDNDVFWEGLPGANSPWRELTGPSDPLVLRACFAPVADDPTSLLVRLTACNRLPGEDVGETEVHVKASGPLMTDRRALLWSVPRLCTNDKASHSVQVKVLGYGRMEVQVKLQLVTSGSATKGDTAPILLNCAPLDIPMHALLAPPPTPPTAADFYAQLASLPVKVELSGVCVWPGMEGAQLLMSSLLRQPMACVLMHLDPSVCGYQAAFLAHTCHGDTLALLASTQLLPGAAPGTSESLCHLAIRSNSADLIMSVRAAPAEWLGDLSHATATTGLPLARPAAPDHKPPPHPRVIRLQQAYVQSAQAARQAASATSLAGMTSGPLAELGNGAGAASGAGAGAGAGVEEDVGGVGPGGASPAWLKQAAMLEWRRLSGLC